MEEHVISLDVRRAWRRSGLTQQQLADALGVSVHTLRRWLYRGGLPSWPAAYNLAAVAQELRLTGPHGTVRMLPDRTPPPAASAAVALLPTERTNAVGKRAA